MRVGVDRLALLVLAFGCREPFGEDRHLLTGDRIAAVTVTSITDDGAIVVEPWLVVDGRPWQDARVDLAWTWVDAEADAWAADDRPPDATGAPGVLRLPTRDAPTALVLRATFPSGDVQRAVLRLPAGGPALLPPFRVALATLDGPAVASSDEDSLARATRLERKATPADHVAEGRWARLEAVFDGDAGTLARVRWMATAGTFLELDAARTDWAPADLELDDLEVEAVTPLDPGPVTVLALALDEAGGQRVATREVWVGEPPAEGVVIGGRWVGTDAALSGPGWFRGRVVADDDAPTGLRLVEVAPIPAPEAPSSPACADGAPFHPDLLATGRCTRSELVGELVIAEHAP